MEKTIRYTMPPIDEGIMSSDQPTRKRSSLSAANVNPTLDLSALFEEHFDYLYSYAFRLVRSEDRAEDLVQETFLAAAKSAGSFQGNSSAKTWLTSILRHKALDLARKRWREEPLDMEAVEGDPLSALFDSVEHWKAETGPVYWGANPDELLKQKQFLAAVENCLKKLPSSIRRIFLLREVEGCGREEISQELGVSSGNIGVILHRARINLQHCLQSTWFDGSAKGVKV